MIKKLFEKFAINIILAIVGVTVFTVMLLNESLNSLSRIGGGKS